jgi:hypothetical protein
MEPRRIIVNLVLEDIPALHTVNRRAGRGSVIPRGRCGGVPSMGLLSAVLVQLVIAVIVLLGLKLF